MTYSLNKKKYLKKSKEDYSRYIRAHLQHIVVRNQHQDFEEAIISYADKQLKQEDSPAFVEMVKMEIKHLHAGIIARYRIKPSDFAAWQKNQEAWQNISRDSSKSVIS